MKITWLGQAGLLMETCGKTIIVDPYLSNSVAKIQPHNERRVAVDTRFLKIQPDIILLTHNHIDHTDPETLCHYLSKDSEITVLASGNAWQNVRKTFGGIKTTTYNLIAERSGRKASCFLRRYTPNTPTIKR